LYAYDYAASLGADVFEMDAHITRDGIIVLRHNETVDSTTDGSGNIEEMTLAELKKLDAGYQWSSDGGQTYPYRGKGIQVPALEELFQKYPDKRYVIEIKLTQNPMDRPFCELIRKYEMQDKVLVASFHDDAMAQFRATCPEVATSAARSEVTNYVLLSKLGLQGLLGQPKYQALQVPWETSESKGITVMTERFIKQAHAQNIAVEPWTVDDPDLMKLYLSWGTDGIMTDRPDVMREVLAR
jgi:glycerophosphoryl diester phosphodiesterase